jgi:hypothetical protein
LPQGQDRQQQIDGVNDFFHLLTCFLDYCNCLLKLAY